MFSKNLKYYRLKKRMTKKCLAEAVNVTSMAITNYENGSRTPDMETIQRLANVLGVKVADFLAVRNEQLSFSHGEFRKKAKMSKAQQEYIRESVEEYFGRFYTSVEILGGEVLPQAPPCHALPLDKDNEVNAAALREHLGLPKDGPVEGLIAALENKGILVYALDIDNNDFSGMNGFVEGKPYIVLNREMSTERNRSTIVHELAHLMFIWPDGMSDDEMESTATAIGGAFLFPQKDVVRELGIKRGAITNDMQMVCREYGISMMMLAKRAQLAGVISETAYTQFCIWASKCGWRVNEPSRIDRELPQLFEQLVYRAVSEEEISVQKGAELLCVPYSQVAARAGAMGAGV